MAVIRLGPFLGVNQALHPKQLGQNEATLSINHRPDRGDLRPWQQPSTVKAVASGLKTIYILGRDKLTDTVYWLVWDTIVHAVRSFRSTDTTKRTYYTGDGAPKVTDNLIGLAGEPYPTAYRDLGVPKPLTQMTLTQTVAGTGTDETRFYAYTYLTDWDEEGPPNVSAAVTCKPGANFNITNLALAPTGPGNNRGINRIRIYRTLTGDAGSAFYVLATIAIATSTTDNALTPGSDTLPSAEYALPPTDLKHLTALWNKFMAGITGKAVRYCELNRPHAWPTRYETLCEDTPVALGVFEKTLVIATTGRPVVVTGTLPENMDDTPVNFEAACVSEQSMVSLGHGCCWATKDGLAYLGTAGPPRLITTPKMLPEQWAAQFFPSTIIGTQYQGRYFGFYNTGSLWKGFMIDPLQPEAGIFFIDQGYSAVFYDKLDKELYVLEGTNIRKWNAGATPMTVYHESKVFRMPRPLNMACAEVIADAYPVQFYLDTDNGTRVYSRSVASKAPFVLPGTRKANDFKVRIESTGAVQGVVVATSMDELAAT